MMKHNMMFLSLLILLLSILTSFRVLSQVQPPIFNDTLFVGQTGWGPDRADPVRAYDSLSDELLFNVYETLLTYNKDEYWNFQPLLAKNVPTETVTMLAVTSTSAVNLANPYGSTWTDGTTTYTCKGYFDFNATDPNVGKGDIIYMTVGGTYRAWYINDTASHGPAYAFYLWRGRYDFNIRTTPTINFYDQLGNVLDTFDIDDAEYSFKRGLVQDQAGSPMWMYYKLMFGAMDNTPWGTSGYPPMDLAHLIDSAIEKDGTSLSINIAIPYSDTAFKQILSETWSSIVSKEFSQGIGCWNGDLYSTAVHGGPDPDWWIDWRNIDRSPYDAKPSGVYNYRYCGTGPYHVSEFDYPLLVTLTKNPAYWRGWPAAGSNASLINVTLNYIADWPTRRDEFKANSLDTCVVPKTYMFDILDYTTKQPSASYPNAETIGKLAPVLTFDAALFTFTVNPTSAYIGTGAFPNGIPTDFFNNTHVRKAFAYSFDPDNHTLWAWYGEAYYRKNWLISGLYNDYYDNTVPGYNVSSLVAEADAESELKAAIFDGTSVWDSGFNLTLAYNTGDIPRKLACILTQDFFKWLSIYDGRTGLPPFNIELVEIAPGEYADQMSKFMLPMFFGGWLSDYSDADDLARPYMHNAGYYAALQNYTVVNGWGRLKDDLVDLGQLTRVDVNRAAVYRQVQEIYYDDCPSYPLTIPMGRRFCEYWVKGWCYNPLYPSDCYYTMWKEDDCWYDMSGTPIVGISDGVTNMKDIAYLIAHFNAKAPDPTRLADPKWVPIYGANGCVDPYGDRTCNMKDIAGAIQHFNHKINTLTP